MLSDDGRKAIQQANRVRNLKCGKCGSLSLEVVDGARIGGLPGITYRYCAGCGWSAAVRRHEKRVMRRLLGLE